MRRFLLACSLTVLPLVPALGQVPDGDAVCAELFESLGAIETTDKTTIESIESGCRLTNGYVELQSPMQIHFDELTLTGGDALAALSESRLPATLEVKGTNVRLRPRMDDALFDYLFDQQAMLYDFGFSLRWDEASGALDIEDFSVASPYIGRIAMRASFSDANLEDLREAVLQPTALGRLENLHLLLEDRGLFAAFAVMPLANLLPSSDDPEALVERYRQIGKDMISSLPATVASDETKEVLTQFLDELPHPTGIYAVEAKADPAVGMEDLGAGPFMLLNRLSIEARYMETDIGLQSLDMDF